MVALRGAPGQHAPPLAGVRAALHDTVAALTYTLVAERCPVDAPDGAGLENEVCARLLEHLALMPDWSRAGLRALTLAFDAWSIPWHGAAFHRLDAARRARALAAWRGSRLAPRRDLVRLYETLVVHTWFSLRDERAAGASPRA